MEIGSTKIAQQLYFLLLAKGGRPVSPSNLERAIPHGVRSFIRLAFASWRRAFFDDMFSAKAISSWFLAECNPALEQSDSLPILHFLLSPSPP